VPNKTIYVSDDDLPLYQRAQELAGGNLSAAISTAIQRYIEVEEGRKDGYDEIIVTIGTGAGRKVRFSGALLGEWRHSTSTRVEVVRVYRSRASRWSTCRRPGSSTRESDWCARRTCRRGWIGNWSPNQTHTYISGEATLKVADTVEGLRELVPPELYDVVAAVAAQPPIEDLDI